MDNDDEEGGNSGNDDITALSGNTVSQTLRSAAQLSFAFLKAIDPSHHGSLFDYADDRRNRPHFSNRRG